MLASNQLSKLEYIFTLLQTKVIWTGFSEAFEKNLCLLIN